MFSTSKCPTISLVYSAVNALNEDLTAFVADGQELSVMRHRIRNKLSKYTDEHKKQAIVHSSRLVESTDKNDPVS